MLNLKKINEIKIKNYIYEVLEYLAGFILYILFLIGFPFIGSIFNYNIDYLVLPFTKYYNTILSLYAVDFGSNSSRLDVAFFYFSTLILIIDIIVILLKSKGLMDIVFDFKYYKKNKSKLISYSIFKYIGIFIFIISSFINEPFFFFYNHYFYIYFIINLIIRIITKGERSLIFYILNLKNI
jgi:hypothetical protein